MINDGVEFCIDIISVESIIYYPDDLSEEDEYKFDEDFEQLQTKLYSSIKNVLTQNKEEYLSITQLLVCIEQLKSLIIESNDNDKFIIKFDNSDITINLKNKYDYPKKITKQSLLLYYFILFSKSISCYNSEYRYPSIKNDTTYNDEYFKDNFLIINFSEIYELMIYCSKNIIQ